MVNFKTLILIGLLTIITSVQAGDKSVSIEKTVVKTKADGTVITKTTTRTNDGNGNKSTTKTTTTSTTSSEGDTSGNTSDGSGAVGASYEE